MKSSNFKINKKVVDNMLKTCKNNSEIDKDILATWLKITKELNDYGQFKIQGEFRNSDLEKVMLIDIILIGYVYRILNKTHPFSYAVMVNRKRKVSSWRELWEVIGCRARETQIKIKKFLVDNSIIREVVISDGDRYKKKQFYVNPFLLRKSAYASQVAINCFSDCAKEGINLSRYAFILLRCIGVID